MTHIPGQPSNILGDPGAVSRDDAIFSGESLLLYVNFLPKISLRLTALRSLWIWITFQLLQVAPQARASAGKPLEPTVRQDDQRFPSQIQDGGR